MSFKIPRSLGVFKDQTDLQDVPALVAYNESLACKIESVEQGRATDKFKDDFRLRIANKETDMESFLKIGAEYSLPITSLFGFIANYPAVMTDGGDLIVVKNNPDSVRMMELAKEHGLKYGVNEIPVERVRAEIFVGAVVEKIKAITTDNSISPLFTGKAGIFNGMLDIPETKKLIHYLVNNIFKPECLRATGTHLFSANTEVKKSAVRPFQSEDGTSIKKIFGSCKHHSKVMRLTYTPGSVKKGKKVAGEIKAVNFQSEEDEEALAIFESTCERLGAKKTGGEDIAGNIEKLAYRFVEIYQHEISAACAFLHLISEIDERYEILRRMLA